MNTISTLILLVALSIPVPSAAQTPESAAFCKGQLATTEEERELEVQGFARDLVLDGRTPTFLLLFQNATEIATATRVLHSKLETGRDRILDYCGREPEFWGGAVLIWRQFLDEALSTADLIGIVPPAEARAAYAASLRLPPMAPAEF